MNGFNRSDQDVLLKEREVPVEFFAKLRISGLRVLTSRRDPVHPPLDLLIHRNGLHGFRTSFKSKRAAACLYDLCQMQPNGCGQIKTDCCQDRISLGA